ncbi:SDR family NAD(P)-dependent oxidoreductase [Nocardia bovistercoris]|uniref:SDR family NAD(P)-dependent oxidoreductase n=1 Tax=Nocardia bovistercoris TaxID=2785916 RepID=A0A931N7K7_9NOCA|nr:SDR family NAD(P)-dependent oxidoreductase [Nocardia bovistercoris]MBH0780848.1 SDR family NAD(P)-dependent oxidoreductase [Nocardia bovistercoris]
MDTTNSSADHSASTVLVTGATSGIGFSVARGLARLGATVLVHGRGVERAAEAVARIGAEQGRVVPVYADIETLSGVRELVDQVRHAAPDGINVLVNNAGAAFDRRAVSADGVERTMAVNHLAVAGLARGLEFHLRPVDGRPDVPPRVIMVTSYLEARARPVEDWTFPAEWSQMRAYATSKLTNLAYTYELAERWRDRIAVYAVDPGAVRTGFQRSAGGPLRLIGMVGGLLMSAPERPARTVVTTAVGDQAHPTGSYLRAVRAEDKGRVKLSSARSRDREYRRAVYEATQRLLSD